jgi:hypothetical protein
MLLLSCTSYLIRFTLQVLGVSALIIITVLAWLLVLMYLKCCCNRKRQACASGGGVIHIIELREIHHLSRSERKNIIRRQWRVQGLALFTCALMIPASFVWVHLGLQPFLGAMTDISDVIDKTESLAYQGMHIGLQLDSFYKNLTQLTLDDLEIVDLCPNQFPKRILVTPVAGFDSLNATANETELINNLLEWKDLVLQGLELLDERFGSINIPTDTLHFLTNVTNVIENGIDFVFENDWYFKLGLLVVDVVVMFWFVAILAARNNIDWIGMQRVAAYFLIPVLLIILPGLVVTACGFWTLLLVNAGRQIVPLS